MTQAQTLSHEDGAEGPVGAAIRLRGYLNGTRLTARDDDLESVLTDYERLRRVEGAIGAAVDEWVRSLGDNILVQLDPALAIECLNRALAA